MKNKDVVYILRGNIRKNYEELRHSLRTVVANWPYRKVWFIGGDPVELVPDGSIYHTQEGVTRYERVRSSVLRACACDDITQDFYLFNDDFFIMQKVEDWQPQYAGTIQEHADSLRERYAGTSDYGKEIQYTADLLRQYGYTQYNYALHKPFLVNKEKAVQTYKAFPSSSMFKDLYGNMHSIGGTPAQDGKISTLHKWPKAWQDVVSTNDTTFTMGYAGMYIRERFPDPCKYERG